MQPDAEAENAYLDRHCFEDYAGWHLGLTEGGPAQRGSSTITGMIRSVLVS